IRTRNGRFAVTPGGTVAAPKFTVWLAGPVATRRRAARTGEADVLVTVTLNWMTSPWLKVDPLIVAEQSRSQPTVASSVLLEPAPICWRPAPIVPTSVVAPVERLAVRSSARKDVLLKA